MTHPIPGADSERAAFEAELRKLDLTDGALERWPSGSYRHAGTDGRWKGWQLARAAAKVGANIAVPEGFTWPEPPSRQGQSEVLFDDGYAEGWAKAVTTIRSLLADGAPAETPKPVAVELIGVAEQIDQGAGFWHSCSGCHDTEDGHPTGNYSYSNEMRCALGSGCAECGGLGAMWDNNDYSEEACNAAQPCPAPIAGDVEKDALLDFCAEHSLHVQTCYAEGSGVPVYEVCIVHGPIESDSLQCMGTGATLREAIGAARAAMLAPAPIAVSALNSLVSAPAERCKICNGTGIVVDTPPSEWMPVVCTCSACNGSGRAAMLANSSSGEAG